MCALEARIAALPEAETLAALTEEDKEALAAELEALVEAYDALTAEEQGMVSNIGRLMEVYQTFQGMMVMTTEEEWGADPHAYVRMQDSLDYELVVNSMDPIPFVALLDGIPESAVERVTFTVYYKTVNNAITTKVGEKVIARDSNGALPEMKYDFTPEKAGSYSVNLVMETSNGEFQDTLSLLVEVGLRIDYVELDPYFIQLGVGGTQEITFTPHLVGDGTLDHFEYVMGTIDTNGQWNAIEGFKAVRSDNMEPYTYVVTDPGTYGCIVTLHTKEGAEWTESSNWCDVLQNETIGQVIRLPKRAENDDKVPEGETETFEMYTGDQKVASIVWTLHCLTDRNIEDVVKTTGSGVNRVDFTLNHYGDFNVSAVMTTEENVTYTSKTMAHFFVIRGGYIQIGDAPEILEGDENNLVPGSTVKVRPVYTNGTPEKVIVEVRNPQDEQVVYEQLTGDHVYTYTFPSTGKYHMEFHAIHEYDDWNWETSSAWDFYVNDADYQKPGIWADQRDYSFGDTVTVHVGIENMDGIESIDYHFYSHSKNEDINFNGQDTKDFVFDPPKGGQYHISADVNYTDGSSVHIDANEDIWVYAGMYPVGVACDPENGAIPVGGSVTFTVLTEGEDESDGTATYDFRLYKPADNEEGRELVSEQLGLTSKSATFQINKPGFYNIDVKMVNGDGCGYYTGWGEVKAGAALYYATTAQGNYGVNDTIEVLTELENEDDPFVRLRFELYRMVDDGAVLVAGPKYMSRDEYKAESRRPVAMSFPAPEGGWAAGIYRPKVFVEYAGGAELENRHGWLFNVVNGSYAAGLERDIAEPAWWQEITFTPIVPEGMEGELTGVRFEIYRYGNLCEGENAVLSNDGTVKFTPRERGEYNLYVTLRNENGEEMTVQNDFFVNTYEGGDRWPGMWSDGDHFEGLDNTIDIHVNIGKDDGSVDENIEKVVWYVWSEAYQKDLVFENTANVLHFKPDRGGRYHAECDVFWKDGWVDHHGAADFEVMVGLYLTGVDGSAYAIRRGGEVTFTALTGGEGEAEEYIFQLYRRDLDEDNENGRVLVETKQGKEPSQTFTINENGYYFCVVTLKNSEGVSSERWFWTVVVTPGPMIEYFVTTCRGVFGVMDDIEVLLEMKDDEDAFKQLRYELYRAAEDGMVLVDTTYLTYAEYQADSYRPARKSFIHPENGWKPGYYEIRVTAEYSDGTEQRHENTFGLDIASGKRVRELQVSQEHSVCGEEVTFTPIFEGEGDIEILEYKIWCNNGEFILEGGKPNGDGSFTYTAPWRGDFCAHIVTRNDKGEECTAMVDFNVRTWHDDEYPGIWTDYDRFEGLDAEILIHLGISDENGNLDGGIEDIIWYVWCDALQKNIEIHDRTNELRFNPEAGGYYHVECDIVWNDGWRDHIGAVDFGVMSGLYPEYMECSAEHVRTGESVTFTVVTAGEGTAQYEYQLYKLVYTKGYVDSEPYGKPVTTDSSRYTFQLNETGCYYCEVKMVNDQNAVYYTDWGDVTVTPGMYISSMRVDGSGCYAPEDPFTVVTELAGEGTFKKLRFELYRWENNMRGDMITTEEVTWAEYQALAEKTVTTVIAPPADGWETGIYNITAFMDFEDGSSIRSRLTWNVEVLNGRRISGTEISNENPVVGETVTVTPSFAGVGSIESIRYELYHDGNFQGELEGGENGCSFQAKWGGIYEVDITFVNDQGEEGHVWITCQSLGIYLEPQANLDLKKGESLDVTVLIRDDWGRLVEVPEGITGYEYSISEWGENPLYTSEITTDNTFTWTPEKPGTYNVEIKVYRDYDEYVLETERTFSVGKLDVLRGLRTSDIYAPVGATVTFTPVTMCEVDSYIYRVFKRVEGQGMQLFYESKATKNSSFRFTFKEPGEYGCQVEVKVNGVSFLDGNSLLVYDGKLATRVQVDREIINIGESVKLDLETVGSGDIGTVTYRIFRDEYRAGDLEKEITVTGGKTAASYAPKFGGSYWIEAEVDDGNGSYRVERNAYVTVRQGRSLEGAEPVTWPIYVDEEAKFQLKLGGEGEIGTVSAHLWDYLDNEWATYENIDVDENGQFTLTFDRTGSFTLEIWMINENGDRYLTHTGFDVHTHDDTFAHWVEMYNDFGFTDARVNTPINYYLHVIGDEENIARIDYYVYYCDVNDMDKCWMLEQFCQMGTTSLDFSFTPDKTGYYWVGAELADKGGNVSFAGFTDCTVSDTRGLRATLSAPTLDGYAYLVNKEISVTAQYEGAKPAKYRMRVTRYDRDFETGEEFYREVVANTKAQTNATFKFKPTQMGYYMVEIELLDKNDAVIGHSCAYNILVHGGDVQPAGAEPESFRYRVGEAVTVNFTYENENLGEVTDVEFVYRWYSIDENGEFTVEGFARETADPADKDSFTFTPEEPGLYAVSVFIRTAQGNYMGYGTDDYIEVLPKETGLRAGALEMADGGRYNQAKVGNEVSFHLNTVGEGEISKIRYEVCYCKNDNFILRELVDAFTAVGESQDFSFTPDKAGYYWVKAVLTNGEGIVSASDPVKVIVSATTVELALSAPDRADGNYSAGKAITITAQYAGTKPKSYKLTVIRDNAELETFTSNDDEMKVFGPQTNPIFKYTPDATGHYQFHLEMVTADNVTIHSFAYVPVVGRDKHMSAITFDYDEYNVYDDVTANFSYEGEGEITDMLIWVGNDTTGDMVEEQYIAAPSEEQQKSFTFTPTEPGVYGITVFAHNSDGSLWELSHTNAVRVLDENTETHWYHLETVAPKDATEKEFGTKGYQYYTCAKSGHEAELFSYPDREPMEDLEALEEANRVYYTGGEIVICKETETGYEPLNDAESVDMAEEPTMKLTGVRKPEEFTQQGVTWSSSAAAVAAVDAEGNVEFLKPGTVTITATATDGGGVKQSVKFTVYFRCQATSIVAKLADKTNLFEAENPAKVGVQVGDTVNLVVTGKNDEITLDPEHLTYKVVSGSATVNAEGVLTALGTGTAKVEVSITGDPLKRKATLSVKLVPMVPDDCEFTYTEENAGAKLSDGYIASEGFVEENGGITLYAIKSGTAKNFYIGAKAYKTALGNEGILQAGQFTWMSSNKAVKVVEGADGYAKVTIPANTAIEAGKCTITATSKQNKAVSTSFQVVVIDFMPKLEKTSITLNTFLAEPAETIGLTSAPGNAVTDVQLLEYDAKGKTYVPCADLSADYANGQVIITAENDLANATRKLRLLAETEHQKGEDAAALDITVTIKNAMPTVTVKQTVKVNLGAFDSTGTLTVTAKLGKEDVAVTKVELVGETIGYTLGRDMDPEKPYVCPVELTGSSKETKGTLVIQLEGYGKRIEQAFNVSTEDKAMTGTLNTYMAYDVNSGSNRVGSFVEVPLPESMAGEITIDDADLKAVKVGSSVHIYAENIIAKGGTRKVAVTVGDVSRIVNVTIKNVAPKITVTQTKKVNQLDKDSVGLVTITAVDGKETLAIGDVTFTPVNEKTALGYVLSRDGGVFKLKHTDPMNIAATKGTLTIPVVGYHYEMVKAFTVAVEKVADKGVLSPATVTMYQKLPGMTQTVMLDTYWESTAIDWEKTEIKAGGATGVYPYLDVREVGGKLQVSFQEDADLGTMKAGTAKYTITPYSTAGTQLVNVTLTVTVSTAPKVTIKPAAVKLSKSQAAQAELTVTAGEAGSYELSRFESDNEDFTVTKDAESGKFLVAIADGHDPAAKTYTVKLTPVYTNQTEDANMADVVLKITVAN